MAPPELVIFDCDGVLVDSEPISNRVLASALTREGLELDERRARSLYQGMLLREIVQAAESALDRELPAGWAEAYERERNDAFTAELRPVAHAREAVELVRAAGVEVCVASQGRLQKTRLSLELTGLRELFDERALFSAESVARGKPHPDVFLHAAASMRHDPDACAVVEDSPSGVTAAVAAGMRALGLAADSDVRALRAAGAEVIFSMAEVPERLGIV